MTTYLSWRYVFVAEVVIMAGVVLFARRIEDRAGARPSRIDVLSVLLSAAGLVFVVYGMLQSKTWGWVIPLHPPVIGGVTVAPLGISPTTWFILVGAALIWAFVDAASAGSWPPVGRRSSTSRCSGSCGCAAASPCCSRSTR